MNLHVTLGNAYSIIAIAGILVGGFIATTKYVVRNEIRNALEPAIEERAVFRQEIAELRNDVDGISAQFQKNGGTSLRDRVVRIETILDPEARQ